MKKILTLHGPDGKEDEYYEYNGAILWRLADPDKVVRWVNCTLTEAIMNGQHLPKSWEDIPMGLLPKYMGCKQVRAPKDLCSTCVPGEPSEDQGMVFYDCTVCGATYLKSDDENIRSFIDERNGNEHWGMGSSQEG